MINEPNVSVAIMTDEEIAFELHGEFMCSCKKVKCHGTYAAKATGNEITITKDSESLVVDNNTIFSPSDLDSESFRLKGVLIGKQFHWQKRENQVFLGSLKLTIEHGQVTAINVIPVERYLESVISSEMNATSSPELLKAHAIISRSWLLAQVEKSKGIDSSDEKYESYVETKEEQIKWYDREDHDLYDVCADDPLFDATNILGVKDNGRSDSRFKLILKGDFDYSLLVDSINGIVSIRDNDLLLRKTIKNRPWYQGISSDKDNRPPNKWIELRMVGKKLNFLPILSYYCPIIVPSFFPSEFLYI